MKRHWIALFFQILIGLAGLVLSAVLVIVGFNALLDPSQAQYQFLGTVIALVGSIFVVMYLRIVQIREENRDLKIFNDSYSDTIAALDKALEEEGERIATN